MNIDVAYQNHFHIVDNDAVGCAKLDDPGTYITYVELTIEVRHRAVALAQVSLSIVP